MRFSGSEGSWSSLRGKPTGSPTGEYPTRHSARCVLVREGRVLLMHYRDVSEAAASESATTFWATPGGGVKAGESSGDTLRREMLEEHNLMHLVIGDEFAVRESVFEIKGTPTRSIEYYFLCTSPTEVLDHSGMTDGERSLHKGSVWVDLRDEDWWHEAELRPHQCKRWIMENRQFLAELDPDELQKFRFQQIESGAD